MLTQKLVTNIRQPLLISFLVLLVNCHRADRIETKEVSFVSAEEEIDGPPPGYKSEFKTIEAWLTDMCKNDKPAKAIDEIRIGVMKSNANYLLYVAGMSTD